MPEAQPPASAPELNRETEAVQPSNAETSPATQATLLQLGVFASRINAEGFRARVSRQMNDSTVRAEQMPENGHFRVYLGPYASPDEARTAAARIEDRTGIQPLVIRRD